MNDMAVSSRKPELSCSECGRVYVTKKPWERHTKKCPKKQPIICKKCGANFKSSYNLKRHINSVHVTEKLYPCTQCGKSFSCLEYLMKHLQKKIHQCRQQEEVVPGIENELNNKEPESPPIILERTTNEKVPTSYTCDFCKQIFKYKKDLKAHILFHLTESEQNDSRSTSQQSGRYSLRAGDSSFESVNTNATSTSNTECSICGRVYNTELEVLQHVNRTHQTKNGVEKEAFPCTLCNLVFRKAYNLQAHMESRHEKLEGNGYCCDYCHRPFTYKVNLEFHIAHDHVDEMA